MNKTKYFLDTEFIEDGKTIDLVSIALVCEDGREFYAESLDADLLKASDWVKENVIANLWSRQPDKRNSNLWTTVGTLSNITGLAHVSVAQDAGGRFQLVTR